MKRLDERRTDGHGTAHNDPTWRKCRQALRSDFDWDTFLSWNLPFRAEGSNSGLVTVKELDGDKEEGQADVEGVEAKKEAAEWQGAQEEW
jgi:hypothetical protein